MFDAVMLFGWAAASSATILGVPQAVRLLRTREVEGISLLAWRSILVVNLIWISHGILIAQWNMIVPNALALFSTIPVLMLLSKGLRLSVAKLVAGPLLIATVLILIDISFGSAAFGVFAVIPAIITNAGQSVDLIRSVSIGGISPLFLTLALVNQLLWVTWASLIHEVSTLISAGTTGAIALFNLTWWMLRKAELKASWVVEKQTPGS